MSFGRIKRRLKALINRKDFTDDLAGDFILDAMSALERDIRIGPMEVLVQKSDWDGVGNAFPVPATYLEAINFFTDTGPIDTVDLPTFLSRTYGSGDPKICTRVADRWLMKPTPQSGRFVYLHFFSETVRPTSDDESSPWTTAGFLATLYKAAELAADFYQMEDDQVAKYAAKAQQNAESIAGQNLSEQWSGRMAIGAPQDIGEY